MDYSAKLVTYRPLPTRLLAFGFAENKTVYTYEKPCSDPVFFFRVTLTKEKLTLDLIDKDMNEVYVPFSLLEEPSSLMGDLREEGKGLMDTILASCFETDSLRNKVLSYVKEKYDADLAYPWEDYPDFCTLKAKGSPKWFGLVGSVQGDKLGLGYKDWVDFLNLKLNPEEIPTLTNGTTYFSCYHMNKKSWMTILLSLKTPWEEIIRLIDESYQLVLLQEHARSGSKTKKRVK